MSSPLKKTNEPGCGTPNMSDIAQLCGVCRQTVSAVLNGKKWVSLKTREKILKVIEEQGFHPNRLATQLQQQTTNIVGVIIRDLSNPFYMQVIQGICDVVQPAGYHLLLVDSKDMAREEAGAVSTMLSYRVRGIILAPIQVSETHDHLNTACKLGNLVSLGEIPGVSCPYIELDDEKAGALAARFAIDRGHTRLGYMAGPKTQTHSQLRLDGFCHALEERGLYVDRSLIKQPGLEIEEQVSAALELLQSLNRPTAIVCYNDLLAVSVYRAAHVLHLNIPDDVSVIGCDDIPVAGLLGPGLTTVVWPMREIGHAAANKMLGLTDEDPIIFAPDIVERESVLVIKSKK